MRSAAPPPLLKGAGGGGGGLLAKCSHSAHVFLIRQVGGQAPCRTGWLGRAKAKNHTRPNGCNRGAAPGGWGRRQGPRSHPKPGSRGRGHLAPRAVVGAVQAKASGHVSEQVSPRRSCLRPSRKVNRDASDWRQRHTPSWEGRVAHVRAPKARGGVGFWAPMHVAPRTVASSPPRDAIGCLVSFGPSV